MSLHIVYIGVNGTWTAEGIPLMPCNRWKGAKKIDSFEIMALNILGV